MTSARAVSRALLAALVTTLFGCPFASDVPLSDPAAAVRDARLVGNWRTQDPESGEWNSVTIVAFKERELAGFSTDKDGTVGAFRIFSTSIGDETFLNLQDLTGRGEGWFYARYEILQDRLHMSIVDDGLFTSQQFGTSAELMDFFRQHLSDPRLFHADEETPTETIWERAGPSA